MLRIVLEIPEVPFAAKPQQNVCLEWSGHKR